MKEKKNIHAANLNLVKLPHLTPEKGSLHNEALVKPYPGLELSSIRVSKVLALFHYFSEALRSHNNKSVLVNKPLRECFRLVPHSPKNRSDFLYVERKFVN